MSPIWIEAVVDSPVVTVGAAVGPLVAVVVVAVAGVVVAAGGLAVELQPASGNAAAARAKVANREWVARSARNGFSTTSADPLQSVYHS